MPRDEKLPVEPDPMLGAVPISELARNLGQAADAGSRPDREWQRLGDVVRRVVEAARFSRQA